MIQMNLQNSKKLTDLEKELMAARGQDGQGAWESHIITLLQSKCITNKDLWYSMWNSAQCYMPVGWEAGLGENGYMYMYG